MKQPKQPKKKQPLAVVEPGELSEMTDSELNDFADSLFDKVRSRWEKDQ